MEATALRKPKRKMDERRRILSLIITMIMVALVISGLSISLLYRTSFVEERERLVVSAQSQARLIEAIARFDSIYSNDYPTGSIDATLSQLRDAHENYLGFGRTGEFALAERDGNMIVFLLRHRHDNLYVPVPIPFKSNLAEPMRRALSGKSGTIIGLDYRGQKVLAAHEPLTELGLGIVAKIDISEVREPFFRTIGVVLLSSAAVILLAIFLFYKLADPLLKQLKDREQKFRSVFESSAIGMVMADSKERLFEANKTMSDMLGFSQEELLALSIYDLAVPSEEDGFNEIRDRLRSGEIDNYILERRYRHKKGHIIWVASSFSAIRDKSGKILYSAGQLEDITARVHAEEALRKSKEELQTIYDGMVDGVLMVDADSKKPVLANPALCRMLGYEGTELLEMSFEDLHPEARLNEARELFGASTLEGVNYGKDIPCLRSDGEVFFADVGVRRISYAGRMCAAGFYRDSTERKRTEESLQQMAAGLAHEIRNPLSAISTGIDLLVRGIGNNTKLSTGLRAESKRLENILTDFLTFSKPFKRERSPGDINLLLAELASLLRDDQRSTRATIELKLDESVGKPLIDRDRIRQVLWNLARNGLESMPVDGKLSISSQNDREQATIVIRDCGNGISKADVEHVFEPFYTTKKEGTGLGLAIAERIVKEHGGSICVESTIGEGTSFRITLPTTRPVHSLV